MNSYRRHPSVVATELSGEVVALHLDTKRYYTLNPTASWIWQALEDGAGEASLVAALTSEFEVTEEQAQRDVAALLSELVELRLVELCED